MENPDWQSDSDFNIIAAITIQNSRAERISPCFTPLSILTDLVIPMSVVICMLDSLYVNMSRLIYILFILVVSRSFQSLSNSMLSKAFVKSMNAILTGLLNSIDFSIVCFRAMIFSIVPLPGWYAACDEGKESYRSLLIRDAIILMKTYYMWLRRLIGW